MKTWKIVTAVVMAVVAASLFGATAFAYMGHNYQTYNGVTTPNGGNFGGMMGGYGYNNYNYAPSQTNPQATTPTAPSTTTPQTQSYQYQYGWGCGGGMRNRYGYTYPYTTGTTATQLNITTAVTIAQNYVATLNNPDLAVAHVEEYTQNFYVQVKEQSTGIGAFELLINKVTGAISPEMGPNMMWNTKYSGMMNGYYTSTQTATMTVTAAQAKTTAQQYLDSTLAGATVGDAATFYGYYTIEVLNAGAHYGMLSVNGYTGQVWYHTWHGAFIQEAEL